MRQKKSPYISPPQVARIRNLCFVILFVFTCVDNVCAQRLPYNFYTVRNGLPGNQIFCMDEDADGFLWIGTYLGLCRFDGVNFKSYADEHPILRRAVKGITARNDSVFVTTPSGVAIIHKGEISPYPFPESMKKGFMYINKAILHRDKLYITLADSYNLIFDIKSLSYRHHKLSFESSIDTSMIRVWSVSKVVSDSLFVRVYSVEGVDYNKYFFYVKNDSIYKSDVLARKYIDDIRRVFMEDYHDLLISKIPQLSQTIINYEFKDSKNGIWVGTEQGLFQIPSLAFEYFTPDDGMPGYVWSIAEDKHCNMWFASWGRDLVKYDGQGFTNPNIGNKVPYYMGASQTKEGFLLPYSGGVKEYADSTWLTLALPSDGYLFTYNDSSANRQFFLGVKNLIIKEQDTIKIYPHDSYDNFLFLSIVKDKKNRYWMANWKGVRIFKDDTFIGVDEDEIPLDKGFICSEIDGKQNLWFGAKDVLIYKYNTIDTLNFPQFYNVTFLKNYRDSLMFVGCKLGLGIIDLHKYYSGSDNYFKFIAEEQGFKGEVCGQNGCFIDSKGQVWFTTSHYVNKLDVSKLENGVQQPNVFFNTFKIACDELQWQEFPIEHFPADSTWVLTYPNNNIQINYESIDLKPRAFVQFRYMLKGYSKQWSTNTEERTVTYTNLKPGEYTFLVQAFNPLAQGIPNRKEFTFYIRPAFWQIMWVRIFFVIAILLIFYLLLKVYYQKKRARDLFLQNQQHELNNLLVANVRTQLNPHFIFNSLNSIGYAILQNRKDAYSYLTKMSKLIRKTLDQTPRTIVTLNEELDFVEDYLKLQIYRFGDKLKYKIATEDGLDKNRSIPKMLIQILVENALIHGLEKRTATGEIRISIFEKMQILTIQVLDNGIGFDTQLLGEVRGTGIKNIRKILSIYNEYNEHKAELVIVSSIGEGTKAEIHIPQSYTFALIKDN